MILVERDFLKKALFISTLGHFAVFSIFSFSFGKPTLQTKSAAVFFWGGLLRPGDLNPFLSAKIKAVTVLKESQVELMVQKLTPPPDLFYPQRPALVLPPAAGKLTFAPVLKFSTPLLRKKETAITFHPLLPYHLAYYFKDRPKIHIELAFKTMPESRRGPVIIKRKISSGNLEADLLAMRYIGHYLFIQQSRFSASSWQTVKIELSAQND